MDEIESYPSGFNKNNIASIAPDESSNEEVKMMLDYLNYDNEKYESELTEKKKKMKFLVEKDTKLRQEQFILEKQIELFSQEITVLKENYKDCNWKINKDFCQSIIKIEKAPALFLNMVEIFLYTLDQKNTSFSHLKEILSNFSNFKNLMINFNENDINEDKICRLMDLWKSNDNLETKLNIRVPGSELLLKWLKLILEIKLKKNTVLNIEEKLKSTMIEKNKMNLNIKELNSQILNMKLNLKKIRFSLNNIKNSRSNNLGSRNMESNTKCSERRGELDICIEPKSKVIFAKRELSNRGNIEILNKESDKEKNANAPNNDIFLINALKQMKINVTPVEDASKPLPPKPSTKKGRNIENKIVIGNKSSTLQLSDNQNLDNIVFRCNNNDQINIEKGIIEQRPIRNQLIIESHHTTSKNNCSKQILNFFC